MKKILMLLLTFILVFTTLLPSYTAYSEETENYCDNMAFSVQTVKVDDEVIEGNAEPESEIKLEIYELEEVAIADDNGEFKVEIKDEEFEVGIKILLMNDQHKIETEVNEVDATVQIVESELDGECEITEEIINESEIIEQSTDDGLSSDETVEEETDETPEENDNLTEEETGGTIEENDNLIEEETGETIEENDNLIQEETDETPEENDNLTDEETGGTIEENDNLIQEETDATSEVNDNLIEEETDEISEENKFEEESVGEKMFEDETSNESFEVDEIDKIEESEEINYDFNDEESVKKDIDKEKLEKEATKYTSDDERNEPEIEGNDILTNEETKNKTSEVVKSDESTLSNGTEIKQNGKENSTLKTYSKTSLKSSKIQSNQDFTEVNDENGFINALEDRNVEAIKLNTNIQLNKDIEVKSRTHTKIIEANGKSIDLGNGQLKLNNQYSLLFPKEIDTMIVKNAENLFTTNKDAFGGFFRKESKSVKLELENISFNKLNHNNGGKIGSNWEGEVHFLGNNLINTLNGDNSLAFRKIEVHENSTLELNHKSDGAAIHFARNWGAISNRDYGMEIKSNADVTINSSTGIMTSNQGSNWGIDFPLLFDIGSGSNVLFEGEGKYLFQNDDHMKFDIKSTESVDFRNKLNNGRLFSNNNTTTFNIEDVSIHGWTGTTMWNELPSHTTNIIEQGIFRFEHIRGKEQTIVESMKPIEEKEDFEKNFSPLMMRIMFADNENHMLDLKVDGITDNDMEIRGTTNHDAKVTMLDDKDKEYNAKSINDEGEFIFILDKPFKAGDILRFQSKYNNLKSEEIEVVVTGNKLEFDSEPENMIFESTEISSGERTISRKDKNWNIKISNTRKNKGWDLHAQAINPLINDNGNTLEEALVFKEDKNAIAQPLKEKVLISSSSKNEEPGTKEISWNDEEGILIEVDPLMAEPGTEYSTTIEWTLTDGPQD